MDNSPMVNKKRQAKQSLVKLEEEISQSVSTTSRSKNK